MKLKSRNLDSTMWKIVKEYPPAGIAWYLMASYAYYHLDYEIISDGAFDKLAKFLKKKWKNIEHPHKSLITKGDLSAGTLLLPKDKFPTITIDCCISLLRTGKVGKA